MRREEEYEHYQLDRLRTDEITQASEQLNGAMKNTFEYELRPDGELYFQGQSLREVFIGGILTAEEIVRRYPQFTVELQRRHIELQQYDAQVALASMTESDNPLVLVHISPTPDAVLSGGVDLNAYDLERKKVMIRVSEQTPDGLRVTSVSLDGNNRVGIQAIADIFNQEITDDMTSEDILQKNFFTEKSQFGSDSPATIIRKRYDAAMSMQYGGEWYAGRQDSEVLHTIEMIQRFPTIISEHVAEVDGLRRRYGKNFRESSAYEKANYNFLAAIKQANELGAQVGSLDDAGDIARAVGIEFAEPDCPTGVAKTAAEALAKQGIEQWKPGQCRVCLERGMVGACEVCLSCEVADNAGHSLDVIHRRALNRQSRKQQPLTIAQLATQQSNYTKYSDGEKQAASLEKYGRHATLRPKIGVGTARLTIVNVLSGLDLQSAKK